MATKKREHVKVKSDGRDTELIINPNGTEEVVGQMNGYGTMKQEDDE